MPRDLQFDQAGPRNAPADSMCVFLHGYGADGGDLLSLSGPLGEHMPRTLFVAPDAPEPCAGNPYGRQWFPIPWLDGSSEAQARDGMLAAADDLNAFLDARLAATGIPASRTFLFGFSQGTMMALDVAPRRQAPFAGVIAVSGRLLRPEALTPEGGVRVKPPIVLIHGDQDQVVPFQDMAAAGEALVAAGFDVYGHVMKGTGHGVESTGLSSALSFMVERLKKSA